MTSTIKKRTLQTCVERQGTTEFVGLNDILFLNDWVLYFSAIHKINNTQIYSAFDR